MPKKGRVVVVPVASRVLAGNPLRDPSRRNLYVYLPPSYDHSNKRYPSVLCLSGFTGSARSWFNFNAWIPAIDERMDRLIRAGMREMILVIPDCFTRWGGSQYLDSPAVGSYRTYLLREIIPTVDRMFRTVGTRNGRGVMGKSSGGFGALSLALEHPETFSAVASHSGDLYFEYAYWPEFPIAFHRLRQIGGLKEFLRKFQSLPKTSRDDHALLNLIAMSACYSPNSRSRPHGFDLALDERTGEVRPEVWKRWKKHDPVEIVKRKGKNLKKFKLVYLDCGTRDEYGLDVGARLFSRELKRQGILHRYEEFEGGHSSTQYRYDRSLRLIANSLSS
jgi:enterochelin esterase-like enzyme